MNIIIVLYYGRGGGGGVNASKPFGHLPNQESHNVIGGNIGCTDNTLDGP